MSQRLNPGLAIPDGTLAKLHEFRRRIWTIKIIEGLCAAAFGLLLSYLLVFVIDRFVDTPAWARAGLLLVGATGLGIWFPLKCHRWVWKTRRFDQLARMLKYRMPRLSDHMLGIIELAQNDIEQQRSAQLCEAALRQVDEDIKDKSFVDAVPHPRHRAWAWAAGVPCAVAILALLVVPAAGINAMKRWLNPWGETARYTFAQLDPLPDKMVVPYSEDFQLLAQVAESSVWKPQLATARIGEQPQVQVQLEQHADGDQYAFQLPPQKQDGVIHVAVGDVRKSIPVEPKLRPELTEVIAEIKLPEYLQYTSTLTRDARGGSLSVVKGSETTLLAKATRRLVSATLDGQQQRVEGDAILTSATKVDDSRALQLGWADEYGLTAKQPFELKIEASDDLPPTVLCSQLNRQQVVMVEEVLTFEVTADDDFGCKEIGIQWQGLEDPLTNPRPASGEAIIKAGSPEASELRVTAAFSPAREGIEPQTLQVRLFTVDYLPTRERTYSPPYTLFVLSQQDHANWLTDQLRRWSRKAQQVYERENQLYEENKALRALSAEELGKRETRDRIETQAAAESANARQLVSVSKAGKQLIKEASRNDQFNVMTMEGLAEMVKTLDELSKNRMPSVADLLKQAASAPSDSSNDSEGADGDAGDGKEKPSAPQVGNNRDPNNTSSGGKGESESEDEEDQKPVPSISDIESSMNQKDEQQDDEQQPSDKKQPKGAAKLGLVSTTVLGGGEQQPQADEEEDDSMEEKLDEAISEQEDLLDDFGKIAEELQRILDNLEGSTFVKRLKAASRRQLEVAEQLNDSLAEKFGRRISELSEAQTLSSGEIAEREKAESENLATIKSDLEAYYSRVHQGKFRTVVAEMDELTVPTRLERLSALVDDNLHGQSIAHAEYWADTFDRWAEQLVGPGCPDGGTAPGAKGDSLSPSIVLDVMKILEKEVGLRDETRATEEARDAMEADKFVERAESLAESQRGINQMTQDTLVAIAELEQEKGSSFPKETQLLRQVSGIMSEVEELLVIPNTGSATVAAETEVIELLLQVQRKQPPKKSSKGGSGTNPNGGGEGDTEESALALLGRGDEQNAERVERLTEQATGTVGSGFPAEYRIGLDTYFGELEN